MNADLKTKIAIDIQQGLYEDSIASLRGEIIRAPEDIEAKMLLGLCCQMAGNECECLEIYEEVRPQMELREASGERSELVRFWQKYRKLVAALFVAGVIPFCNAAESVVTNALGNVKIVQHLSQNLSVVAPCDASNAVLRTTNQNVVNGIDLLKELPSGVQNIKYKDGVISTLVVVGKAAVPWALRRNPGRAFQYGGKRARSEAQLEFVRFLSTKCKWGKTADGATAMKEETASATDAQGNETSAETSSFSETEMAKERKARCAQACISGIQVLWEGMNDSGEYVWIGEWNAKNIRSIGTLPEVPQDPVKHRKYGAPMFEDGHRPAYGVPKHEVPKHPKHKYGPNLSIVDDDL